MLKTCLGCLAFGFVLVDRELQKAAQRYRPAMWPRKMRAPREPSAAKLSLARA